MYGRDKAIWLIAGGLYVLAVALLLIGLDSHPDFTYNWENNTLQGLFPFMEQPSLQPFHILEGLMTDSGSSPWVVFPAWAGLGFGGLSLLSLRLPIVLVAALSVPLLYVLARRLFAKLPGINRGLVELLSVLAAILLALSPVYLLYSRTATDVGISIVPALLTILALLWVLERPNLWWRSLALLGTLLLGAYAYAPVRFLWPMCVGLLVLEAIVRRKDRAQQRRLLISALFLVVAMSALITALDFDHDHDFVVSVGYYYSGRGEQVANLIVNTSDYTGATGFGSDTPSASAAELVWDLISKNATDMANLFLDRETTPAPLDFWNPHGRLMPWWLFPFFLVGFARAGWLGRKRGGYIWRAVVLIFLGFTLPLLLTSQVHIGRLIFAVPLICLFVALGLAAVMDYALRLVAYLSKRRSSASMSNSRASIAFRVACMLILLGAVAWSTWRDNDVEMPPTYEMVITQQLLTQVDAAKERGGGVALVTNEPKTLTLEEINSNQYRLALHSVYRYYNISTGDVDPRSTFDDTRPPLYIGSVIDKLKKPDSVPGYCKNIYLVVPDLMAEFQAVIAAHKSECSQPIAYAKLP